MKKTILLIDDEEDLLELIEYTLLKHGYEVEGFLSTQFAKQFLDEESVDLMIIDRNLPGVEGSLFVQRLRMQGDKTPVIFLSAKDDEQSRIEGFERGGDDYITKPFSMDELVLRVKALLKRANPEIADEITYRDITLYPNEKLAFIQGEPIDLTKLEFRLLYEFVRNKKTLLSRDFLLEAVWGDSDSTGNERVNVSIKRLKEKIDPDKTKNYIQSVRGEGYRFA